VRIRTPGNRLIPLSLVVGAYALALLQRPGLATSDTKIDLHVDPVGFLSRVAAVWSPTQGLGHVQGGQYGGYLWPMGPFFAVLHSIGLGPWLVQRLWLGTLIALAAWGAVRLLDVLLERRRGAAHLIAGALYAVNPYVVVFTSRTTFTLIGYAALPWLLLLVHRGVRDPRRWWFPAAFALVVTSVGGGVNAAVLGWLLFGPLLLLVYEPVIASGVSWRATGAFAWRAGLLTVAACLWWIVPVLVQAAYGLNFLQFTEQVGSIWDTTSLSESLRLMGYWPSYLGTGYGDVLRPYFADSATLLFAPATVVASALVPGLAIAGFARTRRWRYGPFFLVMAMLGALIMSAGFPNGTPLRLGATFAYNHLQWLQFLRTTYKAGPLVALGVACLGGVAFGWLWRRWSLRSAQLALGAAAAALVGLAAWPFFVGRAVELTWKRIPAAWTAVGHDLNRSLPSNSRAVVLPGQPFGFYRWGGTVDPLLPALTSRPVAVRNVPPYDDIHAVDALWTLDNRVQQQRLLPGELAPMLSLLGARAVVTGSDDDTGQSGAMAPAEAARVLAQQGLARASASYGALSILPAPADTVDPAVALPEVRRYDLPSARGLVRVEPVAGQTVIDGSATGIADLGSLGGLSGGGALRYAGDLSTAELRRAASSGGNVVISDSNRRRVFVASRPRQSDGWTLPASVPFSADASVLDPFPHRGSSAQTVAVYQGVRYVSAPFNPQLAQFPEHRPYAALDGNPGTSWLADPTLEQARHYLEVGFERPRDVSYVDVLPDDSNPRLLVTEIAVGGQTFRVGRGWNRLPVRLHGVSSLRVQIAGQLTRGRDVGSAGGLRELRIPGVHVRELLRPPTLAEQALAGTNLTHTPLTYLFERTTADEPLRRTPVPPPGATSGDRAQAEATLVRGAQDAETGLDRVFSPPAARSWSADGWATVSPNAPDAALDALAGTRTGGASFSSSGRFEGRPEFRASSAFDGSSARAWVAPWEPPRATWLQWRTPRPVTLTRLVLQRASVSARFPTRIALSWPGGATAPLTVGPGGTVALPRPVRARAVRLTVLATSGGPPAVAIGELVAPGLPAARQAPASAAVRGHCGVLAGTLSGRPLALSALTTVGGLDAGTPLRISSCGHPLALSAGQSVLHVGAGLLRPLLLELRSPAPRPLVPVASSASGGMVVSSGRMGRGSYSGVRVDVRRPSWLVLGESFNRGWRATCDGRDLGAPQVLDGLANAWRIRAGCREVAFHFAPQTAVNWGYLFGALSCLLLLVLLVARRPRATRAVSAVGAAPPELPADDARTPIAVAPAALAALAAGLVFGFLFAIRAGVVIAPVAFLLLWRGYPTRVLSLAAGGLLAVVVPVLYLLFPGENLGGYDTRFAVHHLGAHWVTVAAFALLILALIRTISTATGRRFGARARARAARARRRAPA